MTNILIHRTELKEWLSILEREFSIPDDNIDQVKESIKRIIHEHDEAKMIINDKKERISNSFQMKDIIEHKTYMFDSDPSIKKALHGRKVVTVRKKRKYVLCKLLEDTPIYKKGTMFDVPPYQLKTV